MMAGITLNKMGLRVLQANNGQEAIDAWQQGGIDLILMDVQMPTMDGYEATRTILELEEQQHKAHVPIIAMTANVLVEDRLEAEQAGMDDHLPKPFKWEQLEAILSKWLPAENKHVLTSELTETTDTKVMSENEFTVLDAARIAESIRTLGEHYPRMVDMTIASVKKSIDLLQQASEDDNIATLGSEAHRLKGAVGTMGGPQMMDICRLIELYAESNDLVLAQQQVELLASAFENLQSALKQTLEESSQDLT